MVAGFFKNVLPWPLTDSLKKCKLLRIEVIGNIEWQTGDDYKKIPLCI